MTDKEIMAKAVIIANKWLNQRKFEFLPKAVFENIHPNDDTLWPIMRASEILNLGFKKDEWLKGLHICGILDRNSNKPAKKFVDAGYFVTVYGADVLQNGEYCRSVATYCTQKGLVFLRQLFSKNSAR